MTACESVRGTWGEICPDCGQPLPDRQPPLSSWKANKPMRDGVSWDGRSIEHVKQSAAQRERVSRERQALRIVGPAREPERQRSFHRIDVRLLIGALREAGGNASRAAVAIGVSGPSVWNYVSRHRDEFPADVLQLVDRRRRNSA